jgi:hypothetical protein
MKVRNEYRILVGNMEGTDHLEDLGIDGKTILKWSSKEEGVRVWSGLIWLRIDTLVSICGSGNEHTDFIKGVEFLD